MSKREKKDLVLLESRIEGMIRNGVKKSKIYKELRAEGWTYPTIQKYYEGAVVKLERRQAVDLTRENDALKEENSKLNNKMKRMIDAVGEG